MSIFTWWSELKAGMRKVEELKAIEKEKIEQLVGDSADPHVAAACLESITLNLKKRDTDKVKKKE